MTVNELRDKVDVAIICVNDAECSAVLRHFPTVKKLQGERTYRIAVVEREDGQEMTVAVVVSSEGPIESAKTMEHIASQLDPTLTLLVGIAGGIPQRKGSLVFGDVALSSAGLDATRAELNPGRSYRAKDEKPFDLQMWALDLVKNTHVNDCWASPEMVKVERPPDEELIKYPECNEAWFSEVKRNFAERDHSRPVLLRGTFSSGYGFLRDDTLAKKWRKILESANYPPLVANEMELIGVHIASSGQKRNHQYLVIKGISDIIGLQRTGPWTPYAAATAASFAFGFVRALTFEPKIRNGARDTSPRPPRGRDTLPWLRFWCPTSRTCQLDQEGFLVDPRGPFARAINPHVVTLDSLDGMGCLVLLGEPGMGKSVALSGEFWRVFPEARALWWSMEGYSDEARLVQELFSSEHWRRWLDSDYTLWLFIDAFDEGLLEVSYCQIWCIAGFIG